MIPGRDAKGIVGRPKAIATLASRVIALLEPCGLRGRVAPRHAARAMWPS